MVNKERGIKMIEIVEGNLLNATEDIIEHQVNCKGVMGSGLAKQIKSKYNGVYLQYKRECDEELKRSGGTQFLLGHTLNVEVGKGKYVSNLFGQDGYGRDTMYTDYPSLKRALIKLEKFARKNNLTVALPYGIGSGLAGGNWETVYKIIEHVFGDYEVALYRLK